MKKARGLAEMEYFISHKFTGEDRKKLEGIMRQICDTFTKHGHENYCTLWKEDELAKQPMKGLFQHAFNEIDKADTFVAFINSEGKSEGMLIEMGYALAKGKKFILLINKKVKNTHTREIADKVIEFRNLDELKNKLKDLK